MIKTLYLTSQTEADTPEGVYTDQWKLSPYQTDSMFCAGITSREEKFVIPDDFIQDVFKGIPVFQRANARYELATTNDGKPVLRIWGSPLDALVLEKPQAVDTARETPTPQAPRRPPVSRTAFVPLLIDGEWEIF